MIRSFAKSRSATVSQAQDLIVRESKINWLNGTEFLSTRDLRLFALHLDNNFLSSRSVLNDTLKHIECVWSTKKKKELLINNDRAQRPWREMARFTLTEIFTRTAIKFRVQRIHDRIWINVAAVKSSSFRILKTSRIRRLHRNVEKLMDRSKAITEIPSPNKKKTTNFKQPLRSSFKLQDIPATNNPNLMFANKRRQMSTQPPVFRLMLRVRNFIAITNEVKLREIY